MKKIALLCFFLVVLPLTVFSIPVNILPAKQTDRKESYNTLFSLITKLSSNVETERNEFLNLSKLEDKTSKDKKLEIDKKNYMLII
jgi:biopolymer transport protein ExbD